MPKSIVCEAGSAEFVIFELCDSFSKRKAVGFSKGSTLCYRVQSCTWAPVS